MKAIILVGGFGTRLRPLTLTTPKQMLLIAGVPQIERKIAHLVSHGVDDIVLSMGYKPEPFMERYPDGHCAGARLTYVIESEPLGTAGAIAFAARRSGVDDVFLAMNGDTLTDLNISQLIELHKSSNASGTLALTEVDDPSRFGVVVTNSDNKVSAFIEKPERESAPSKMINAGTYVLDPEFIEMVEPGKSVSIEREIFPKIADSGELYAKGFSGYWLDIGTPDAFIQGNVDALNMFFEGANYVEDSAFVDDAADVAMSSICEGSSVARNATVKRSVLLSGAVVQEGAFVENSVVGERAIIKKRAVVKDTSVIGSGEVVAEEEQLHGEKRPA